MKLGVFTLTTGLIFIFTISSTLSFDDTINYINNYKSKEKKFDHRSRTRYKKSAAKEAAYYRSYAHIQLNEISEFGRPGNATLSNSCHHVRAVPAYLRDKWFIRPHGISSRFYQLYTEAYGIPVIGSIHVHAAALRRACYVLRFLLADSAELRQSYYKRHGRVAVLARHETVASLPELYFLPRDLGEQVRGLGAVQLAPVTSAGTENVRCNTRRDRYRTEDVLLRELAIGILNVAVRATQPEFMQLLRVQHETALKRGLWNDTQGMYSPELYLGEGVQSYFNANGYSGSSEPDGSHGIINTRWRLQYYDPGLYRLVRHLFPCANSYISRCTKRENEKYQKLPTNCASYWPSPYE